jgi:hypothetical protein
LRAEYGINEEAILLLFLVHIFCPALRAPEKQEQRTKNKEQRTEGKGQRAKGEN